MANIEMLSHVLSANTPAYGGGESLSISAEKEIAKGDTANTSGWKLPNHLGTHVDVPRHFFSDGPSVSDYPPSTWHFYTPQVIETPVKEMHLIGPADLATEVQHETDLLILRTGFGQFRGTDKYWKENPGVSAELALELRSRFPNLRMIGFDFISLTSPQHKREGKLAHQAFLDPAGEGEPILILEDMNLSGATKPFNFVSVAPLMVQDSDGSPCTVFAFY